MLGAKAISVPGQHNRWKEGVVYDWLQFQHGGVRRECIIVLVRAYDSVVDLTAAGPPILCVLTVTCCHQV
jgi:hypothetical protein